MKLWPFGKKQPVDKDIINGEEFPHIPATCVSDASICPEHPDPTPNLPQTFEERARAWRLLLTAGNDYFAPRLT